MNRLPSNILTVATAAFLLAVFIVQTTSSVRMDSATFDEGVHLAAGFHYLKTSATVFEPGNPPLPNIISALPELRRCQ